VTITPGADGGVCHPEAEAQWAVALSVHPRRQRQDGVGPEREGLVDLDAARAPAGRAAGRVEAQEGLLEAEGRGVEALLVGAHAAADHEAAGLVDAAEEEAAGAGERGRVGPASEIA
jgi:hypothetical protein